MSTEKLTEANFKCITCNKVPPPLSPELYNTTRPFVICADYHVVCHWCFIRQPTYQCGTCKKESQLLLHVDVFLQPPWLKDLYKKVVAKTQFDCARQCLTQLPVGGKALLEHEENCKFDPPCVCPMCDSYAFYWPKNDKEKETIIKEHGHHLEFTTYHNHILMIEDIYDKDKKELKSQSRCAIFEPIYDYYHCSTGESYKLEKVDGLSKRYPYIAIWLSAVDMEKNPKYRLNVKWLQHKSRIIPDASYNIILRMTNFHGYKEVDSRTFLVNIVKPDCLGRHSMLDTVVLRTFNDTFLPCSICTELRKHFHISAFIYNKAISECKTRYYV